MSGTKSLAPPSSRVLSGIIVMCGGVLLFVATDALGKVLVGTYPVGELMVVRGITGLAVMLPLLRFFGLPIFIRHDRPRLQLVRFVLSPAEASLFFWALVTLPLAEVITYYQAAPIWVVALSALFLGERVGWRRWTAVLAGFGGVVLALHPQATPAVGAGFAVAGSLLYAGYLVATGRLGSIPRSVLSAQQLLATLLYGVAITALEGWTVPSPRDAALMVVLGLGSLAGNLCVNLALKLGPPVSVVPFQYTMLIWGFLIGFVIFGDVPSGLEVAGAGIIVAAGLFILVREHRLARNKPA